MKPIWRTVQISFTVDFIHCNPFRCGQVALSPAWQHSTLLDYIDRKTVSKDCGVGMINETDGYGDR